MCVCMRLWCVGEFSNGEQAFAEVNVKAVFDSYHIESATDNEIGCVYCVYSMYGQLHCFRM